MRPTQAGLATAVLAFRQRSDRANHVLPGLPRDSGSDPRRSAGGYVPIISTAQPSRSWVRDGPWPSFYARGYVRLQ